jgi:hypothetical protein
MIGMDVVFPISFRIPGSGWPRMASRICATICQDGVSPKLRAMYIQTLEVPDWFGIMRAGIPRCVRVDLRSRADLPVEVNVEHCSSPFGQR